MGQRQSIVKAAGKGDFSRVRKHLNKKGRRALYEKEPPGWTALHKAARAGKLEMVDFLVQNNAVFPTPSSTTFDPSLPPFLPLLRTLCCARQLSMLELRTEGEIQDVEATDSAMCTPLHCACWKGHLDVVEHLLEAGANPQALTESGWSPLHTAAFRGHALVAEFLLKNTDIGAGQRDLMGYTPLELAEKEEVRAMAAEECVGLVVGRGRRAG
jgi:ankyrin repeat protein